MFTQEQKEAIFKKAHKQIFEYLHWNHSPRGPMFCLREKANEYFDKLTEENEQISDEQVVENIVAIFLNKCYHTYAPGF